MCYIRNQKLILPPTDFKTPGRLAHIVDGLFITVTASLH